MFYISVFHTPNTFKITQKGYYYDIDANLWNEAPVVHERARYCPTCCLTFPRKILNFNENLSKIVINYDEKKQGKHANDESNELTQIIDNAITSTISPNDHFCSVPFCDDKQSDHADNSDGTEDICFDGGNPDISISSNS
jgi:hypothetical protein